MDRKGQAAMEFLMTYGWAILAAIIAIGVLAYYGIFSPGKFVTNAVVIQAPFGANGVIEADTGTPVGNQIKLEMRNGAGQLVTITDIDITDCLGTVSNTTTGGSFPTAIPAGDDEVFTADCEPDLVSGSTFKGDIKVVWTPQDSSLSQTTTGSITYRVP